MIKKSSDTRKPRIGPSMTLALLRVIGLLNSFIPVTNRLQGSEFRFPARFFDDQTRQLVHNTRHCRRSSSIPGR